MNQKELTKTFILILNWKTPYLQWRGSHHCFYYYSDDRIQVPTKEVWWWRVRLISRGDDTSEQTRDVEPMSVYCCAFVLCLLEYNLSVCIPPIRDVVGGGAKTRDVISGQIVAPDGDAGHTGAKCFLTERYVSALDTNLCPSILCMDQLKAPKNMRWWLNVGQCQCRRANVIWVHTSV